jgi:NADH-quinone oxidoreductase subunit I
MATTAHDAQFGERNRSLTVAQTSRPLLGFAQRLYLPLLTGLKFTFRVMFRKRIVRLYPEEPIPRTSATRGQPRLAQNDDKSVRCVACGLCEFVCPAYAITIYGGETDRFIEREPKEFKIDMLRCILCGFCEEVCPKEAIFMSSELELAGPTRTEHVLNKEQLLRPLSVLQPRIEFSNKIYNRWKAEPAPADPKANPAGDAQPPVPTSVPPTDPSTRPAGVIASPKPTR